jgi:hypothetical protein
MATLINRSKALEVIDNTNGAFFTAWFVKKDGSIRKLTGRIGVRKDLKGKGSTVARPDTPYRTVWDTTKKAYRVINLETVLRITANKETFMVRSYEKFVSIVNNELIVVKGA